MHLFNHRIPKYDPTLNNDIHCHRLQDRQVFDFCKWKTKTKFRLWMQIDVHFCIAQHVISKLHQGIKSCQIFLYYEYILKYKDLRFCYYK